MPYILEEIKYLRAARELSAFLNTWRKNHAFLFSDFLSDTGRHRLRYLCDTQLSFLFPSTFGSSRVCVERYSRRYAAGAVAGL